MERLQLFYFQKVALSENLTKTARELFITPSALSMSISRLEKELGVNLFDRTGNHLTLNEQGKKMLFYTNRILNDIDEAIKEVREDKKNELNIVSTTSNIWAELINQFSNIHPEIKVSQRMIVLHDLSTLDLRNNFDFLLASSLDFDFNPPPCLNQIPLYTDDRPMLMVWEGHPFTKLNEVSLYDAKDETFVALAPGLSSRKLFDFLCKKSGFYPKISIECDYMMRAKLVANKSGIAMATARTQYRTQYEGCSFVSISDPFFLRDQNLYWDKNRLITFAAKEFLGYAKEFFRPKHPLNYSLT